MIIEHHDEWVIVLFDVWLRPPVRISQRGLIPLSMQSQASLLADVGAWTHITVSLPPGHTEVGHLIALITSGLRCSST